MKATERINPTTYMCTAQAGIRAVTMDDIAKHLGISKKTIYLHFADKDKLVYELIQYRISADQQHLAIRSINQIP